MTFRTHSSGAIPARRLRPFSDEGGFALVVAIGMLLVLGIAVTSLISYSSSTSRDASLSGADQSANSLAEAGLSEAASTLAGQTRPDRWTGHPTEASPSSVSYASGTVNWWADSVSCSPDTCWRLKARSSVSNPTGPAADAVHRTLSLQMRVVKAHTTGSQTGNYIYADNNIKIDGSAVLEEPVIAGGDLDMGGTTTNNMVLSVGQVVSVKGQILLNNGWIGNGATTTLTSSITASSTTIPVANASGFTSSGTVKIDSEWIKYSARTSTSLTVASTCGSGSSLCRGYGGLDASPAASHSSGTLVDARMAEVHAVGGCSPLSCAANTHIFPATAVDNVPIPFTKPAYDVATEYAEAAPGPKSTNTCTGTSPTGSFSTFFDNQTPATATLNHSISTTINLTASQYDCTATAPDGTAGRIKWDGTTLTVNGTVFFDGDINFGNNGKYSTGSDGGTIFTSGDFGRLGRPMCGAGTPPACDFNTWDPATNVLGIVASTFPGSTNSHCMSFSSGGRFQGVLYASGGGCTYGFDESSGAALQGLVIADNVHLSGSAGNPSPSITRLPNGFPGVDTFTVSYVGGTYGG